MFLGKFLCGLDEELRFLTPAAFKKYLKNEAYITQGFDRNLLVLTGSAFQALSEKFGHLNIADPSARLLFRLILGAANEARISTQGYMKIPKDLQAYAKIENEIFLIGQGDYFEIWSPAQWKKQEIELRNTEINAERFSTFNITTR